MKQKQKKIILTLAISITVFIGGYFIVQAATYYWTQSSWTGLNPTNETDCTTAGGAWVNSECVASHSNNAYSLLGDTLANYWTRYSNKSSNATTGDSISISLETASEVHNDTAEFTHANAVSVGVTTTGDQIGLSLP
jgi:hypothetical protein